MTIPVTGWGDGSILMAVGQKTPIICRMCSNDHSCLRVGRWDSLNGSGQNNSYYRVGGNDHSCHMVRRWDYLMAVTKKLLL